MEQTTAVSKDEVLGKLREIMEPFDVPPEKVALDSSFDLLGLDSLDLVELSMKIEDLYGIEIEENDLESVWQVGHAVDLVLRKLAERA